MFMVCDIKMFGEVKLNNPDEQSIKRLHR